MATYRYLDDGTPDGTVLGQSTASLIGFYNATPIARPAATNQFAITDGVTGTVNATTGVSAFTASELLLSVRIYEPFRGLTR